MNKYRISITLEGTAPSIVAAKRYLNAVKQLVKNVTVYQCSFKIVSADVEELKDAEEISED